MNKSYSQIAPYYDGFTQNDCDYARWAKYLASIAAKGNVKKIVDLACGTGKMTRLLSERGFDVLGVDVSREMLNVAISKCRKAIFIESDATELRLPNPADMAVCVNDGINYVPPHKLEQFFYNVCLSLKCGSAFVFDFSSEYKLRNIIADNVFYDDGEEKTLLWTNELKSDSVEMSLTLFVKNEDVYVRQDEKHIQYIYSPRLITEVLEKIGFDVAEITSDYGLPLKDDSLRITFYAVKRR